MGAIWLKGADSLVNIMALVYIIVVKVEEGHSKSAR